MGALGLVFCSQKFNLQQQDEDELMQLSRGLTEKYADELFGRLMQVSLTRILTFL